MTDHVHQYITLDDDTSAAVFVRVEGEQDRVLYDLDKLLDQYYPALLQNAMDAHIAGDVNQKIYCTGILDTLKSIEGSIAALREEAIHHGVDENFMRDVNDLHDMFGDTTDES